MRWLRFVLLMASSGSIVEAQERDCARVLQGPAHTIAAVLDARCISMANLPPVNVSTAITSYGEFRDKAEYLLAYYEKASSEFLEPPLHVLRMRFSDSSWHHVRFSEITTQRLHSQGTCLGSVSRIEKAGDYYLLNTHLTPSAGCVIVLNADLSLKNTFYGWTVATFPSGRFIYRESMVHFAPTHPLNLFAYDPAQSEPLQIFPLKDDPHREAYKKRLREAINQSVCMSLNSHCDPEQMETDPSETIIHFQEQAFAFHAVYSPRGFIPPEKDWKPWKQGAYYFYRFTTYPPLAKVLSEEQFKALETDLTGAVSKAFSK